MGLNLRLHPPSPLPEGTDITCFELLTEPSPGKLDPVWKKITDERVASLICACVGEYQGLADAVFDASPHTPEQIGAVGNWKAGL